MENQAVTSAAREAPRSNTATVTTTTTAPPKVLHLKLKEEKKQLKWTEDTIDNEHMGKKNSKRCCIFHKNKVFGESDSDESDEDAEVAKRSVPPEGRPKNYQRHHA